MVVLGVPPMVDGGEMGVKIVVSAGSNAPLGNPGTGVDNEGTDVDALTATPELGPDAVGLDAVGLDDAPTAATTPDGVVEGTPTTAVTMGPGGIVVELTIVLVGVLTVVVVVSVVVVVEAPGAIVSTTNTG